MSNKRTINVRLVRGFDHPRGHRRAGVAFVAGPTAQELEVDAEQYEAIKNDPSLEIVSDADAKKSMPKMTAEQIGQTKDQQDVNKVIGEPDTGGTPQTRRRYISDDPTRAESPEQDPRSILLEQRAQTGEYAPKQAPKTASKAEVKPSPRTTDR